MAQQDFTLTAEERKELGSAACRRLRRRGLVPGNVYGHRQTPVAIAVPAEVLDPIVHSGHRVVELKIDGKSDTAMFREVQWDTYGMRIQHFDLVRVSADERVTVEVPIELKGVAQGIASGGMLEHLLRELTVECQASQIPDSIEVNVTHLGMGDSLLVRDIKVPEGAVVQDSPDATVLHIIEPGKGPTAEELGEEAAAEPEVIGRAEAGEEEGEKD